MSLSCGCDYDMEPGAIIWEGLRDYAPLTTKRARQCCSCGTHIAVGDLCAEIPRYKVPEYEIEINIYGEYSDNGPPRASRYMCESCADIANSLEELGFCVPYWENQRGLLAEYTSFYGHKPSTS